MALPDFHYQHAVVKYLFFVGVMMLFGLISNWYYFGVSGPDDVEARLRKHSKNSEFICRVGEGDWDYFCDEYSSKGHAKTLVGVIASTRGFVWTSFPAGVPMSKAELRAYSDAQKAFWARVDLNSSRQKDFAALPGVDQALAWRIVEMQRAHAFASVDDLKRVEGMDAATFERIRPLVRFNGDGIPRAEDFVGHPQAN